MTERTMMKPSGRSVLRKPAIFVAAAGIALAPALYGLISNPSLSLNVPVTGPSRDVVAEPGATPGPTGAPSPSSSDMSGRDPLAAEWSGRQSSARSATSSTPRSATSSSDDDATHDSTDDDSSGRGGGSGSNSGSGRGSGSGSGGGSNSGPGSGGGDD